MMTDGDREREEAEGGAEQNNNVIEGDDQDDNGTVHPSKMEPVSEKVVHNDKYAPELPITHLINPVNKRVFAVTPDLLANRDLVPCDKHGTKVYDHRCF